MTSVDRESSKAVPEWLKKLECLLDRPEGAWWQDVLADHELFIAVRQNGLDVYHRGGVTFSFRNGVNPQTHNKYLVQNRQAYASLEHGQFKYQGEVVWQKYERKKTIEEIKAAAAALAGPEKFGLHQLIMNTPDVIDVEITIEPASDALDEVDLSEDEETSEAIKIAELDGTITSKTKTNRLDAAILEECEGTIQLVFYEAKHFANKELRAKSGDARVIKQIKRYKAEVDQRDRKAELKAKYQDVCRWLVEIDKMRNATSSDNFRNVEKSRLIRRVADGAPLEVCSQPRLIVFGYDKDQACGKIWKGHRKRLEAVLGHHFHQIGSTKRKQLP